MTRGQERWKVVVVCALLGALASSWSGRAWAAPRSEMRPAASDGKQGAGPKRFALVVGSNVAVRPGLPTLRYADDDAVKWAILLRTFGVEVELLTDLDPDSSRLYGPDAPGHRSPTHLEIDGAMTRLRKRIAAAKASGARTIFYFVYAGHGDEQGGEGFLGLADGRLLRGEIERRILTASDASTNHMIIDACRSYYIAHDRGPGGSRRKRIEPYFNNGTASRFRNTGFLLASSSDGATHEWEEFQAGIFSHEVRSGLLGGADTDGDGRITYAELAAFVRVANSAVRNERYRPEILARPPDNGDGVLLDMRSVRNGRLLFGGIQGRHVLEDGLGVRWADVHPGPRQHLTLVWPMHPWAADVSFVQSPSRSGEYRIEGRSDVDLAALTLQPRSVAGRGALHEAFELLFSVPFDARALRLANLTELNRARAVALEAAAPEPFWRPETRGRAALGTALGGIGAFSLMGGLLWSAADLRQQGAQASGADRAAFNDGIDTRNRWAAVSAATGALLAAATGALLLWDTGDED